jgi:hypothetical protein
VYGLSKTLKCYATNRITYTEVSHDGFQGHEIHKSGLLSQKKAGENSPLSYYEFLLANTTNENEKKLGDEFTIGLGLGGAWWPLWPR